MFMDLAVDAMNPKTGPILRDYDIGGAIERSEFAGLSIRDKLSNMNVPMTLCAPFDAVISNAPLVSPKLFTFGDGSVEKFRPIGRIQIEEIMGTGGMFTRQRQHPIGLARVRILQEKHPLLQRLLFGLLTETTVHGSHRFRLADITGAITGVGQNKGKNNRRKHFFSLCSFRDLRCK
jgi:hypothetical protein